MSTKWDVETRTCFLSSFLRAISAAFSSFDIVWCCGGGAGDAPLLGVGVLSDGVDERKDAEIADGCRAGVGRGFAGGFDCVGSFGNSNPRLGEEGAGAGALSKAPVKGSQSTDAIAARVEGISTPVVLVRVDVHEIVSPPWIVM